MKISASIEISTSIEDMSENSCINKNIYINIKYE